MIHSHNIGHLYTAQYPLDIQSLTHDYNYNIMHTQTSGAAVLDILGVQWVYAQVIPQTVGKSTDV